MIVALRHVGLQRLFVPALEWMRRHQVTLVRFFAVLAVAAVTAIAGYVCHGLVGPPG